MCDHSYVYTSSSVRQSRHIVSEWWNSPTIYTFLKHEARSRYSLHYIAYLEKGRFFVTSAKLHIPFLSLSCLPYNSEQALEGRLMLSKGWKEKIKSRKFIPFFPSSHHDIYARAHTHMTLNKTGNKRGLTMMRRNCMVSIICFFYFIKNLVFLGVVMWHLGLKFRFFFMT